MSPRKDASGLSLLELLIVVGIIALLVAILLPALARVRSAARSARCLSHLQQWGQAFQMYLSSNHVKTLPEQTNYGIRWFEALAPYGGSVRAILICPEASDRNYSLAGGHGHSGTATSPWRNIYSGRDYFGSYGFNVWIYKHPYSNMTDRYFQYPVNDSSVVPLMGDCCVSWAVPLANEGAPANVNDPVGQGGAGLTAYCINRHRMAINIGFLDGHAERESLGNLWRLRWCQSFIPRDMQAPAP